MTTPDQRPRIRPDVKEWWTTRLTDGTYEQLRDMLTEHWVETEDPATGEWFGHAERACCLGVLTGVAIEHGCPDVRWDPEHDGGVQWFNQEDYHDALTQVNEGTWPYANGPDPENFWVDYTDGNLPEQVVVWAFDRTLPEGVRSADLTNPVLDEIGSIKAIRLNDDLEASFDDIAALVRRMPEADEPAVKA